MAFLSPTLVGSPSSLWNQRDERGRTRWAKREASLPILPPRHHPSPLFYRPVPSKRLKGHPGSLLLSRVNKSRTRTDRGRGFISHVYWRRLNSHRLWGYFRYRLLSLNVIAPCPHMLGFLLSRHALRTADWPTVWCHTSSDSRAAW